MYEIDLKEFRRANRMTQKDLAYYFGVGQGFVSQMEKGIRPVPDKYIGIILADETKDSSMVRCSTPGETMKSHAEDDFKRSIISAISAVEKIAESNRILAESNHDLTMTNKILATSNTELVQKLAGLLDEIRGINSVKYTTQADAKGPVASDVEGVYGGKKKFDRDR